MSFRVLKAPLSPVKDLVPFRYQEIRPIDRARIGHPMDQSNGSVVREDSEPPLNPTNEEIDAIRKRAFEEGYLQGERAGRELGEKAFQPALERLSHSLEELVALKEKLCQQVEKEAVRLSLEIARKIVKQQVQMDPDIVLQLIKVAGQRITEKTSQVVKVHPLDYGVLIDKVAELEGMLLRADPSVDRGGCVIETDHGCIDARIDTQFEEVERSLLGADAK